MKKEFLKAEDLEKETAFMIKCVIMLGKMKLRNKKLISNNKQDFIPLILLSEFNYNYD